MTDEPIILTTPRWSLIGAVVIPLTSGGGLLWAAVLRIQSGESRDQAGGLALCIPAIMLLGLGLWAVFQLLGSGRIEIGPAGLRLPGWRSVVAWPDLAPFKLVYGRKVLDLWSPSKMRLEYHDAPPGKAFVRWAVGPTIPFPSLIGTTGLLSTTYLRPKGIVQGPEALVEILEYWRTKYADHA